MRPYTRIVQVLIAVALAAGVGAPQPGRAGRARQLFEESRYLENVPEPGPCDVVITTTNQNTTIPMLDDPSKYVFCISPGNYRAQGHIRLYTSGTSSRRRYLRYNGPSPTLPAIRQSNRVLLHGLILNEASWWVVDGITVQPTAAQDLAYLVAIFGSSRNVIQGSLIDASLQPNHRFQQGIVFGSTGPGADVPGIPSTYNTIQRNVIRGGNKSRLPLDYTGINIPVEDLPGANSDYNKILDNEIYDWGDGIQISRNDELCNGALPRGTLIDNNDIYITKAKRVRCSDGAPDPSGECSCSENAIDMKVAGGANPVYWTRITNNRMWGFRPTLRDVPSCGGSGARGQAVTAGNPCAGYVFVARNKIMDSTVGVMTNGTEWRVVGNLIYEMRDADDSRGVAIFPLDQNDALIQFNTAVAVDNSYTDSGSGVLTQCNAVIHDRALEGAQGSRGTDHVTRYNTQYESFSPEYVGSTNVKYPNDNQSQNRELCFYRKRWTQEEEVCIPFAETVSSSPHAVNRPTACATNVGADFGLPTVFYP
jgi:hypothetical protein